MDKTLIFLKHILKSIENIEKFSKKLSKEKFSKDEFVQSAIIRQLEIIGEAVKNLPMDFTNKHSEIPWKDIAGTRDKLIHGYFGVDLDLVWGILNDNIPKLKKFILEILKDLKEK